LKEEEKEYIRDYFVNQPLDGLLYDLDLMPEQIQYGRDRLLHRAIVELRKEIDRLNGVVNSGQSGHDE
jgi:hypothetical protein